MKVKSMKTAMLSLATVAGLASGAFADAPVHPMGALVTGDIGGYIMTDYVPHLKRTIIEMKVSTLELEDSALWCANNYTAGTGAKGTDYAYGNYFQCYFTGDKDVSYEIQGTNDLYVALLAEHVNTALTIRAGDNWIEALDAGGNLIGRSTHTVENTDTFASGPLCLFNWMYGRDNAGTVKQTYMASKKVYWVKVWEVDEDDPTTTTLKHEYVPALSEDNVKTLWDTVDNKYLTPTDGDYFLLEPTNPEEHVMVWSGAGENNNFSNAANWTNGVAPGRLDSCIFTEEVTPGPRSIHFDVTDTTRSFPLMQDFYCTWSQSDFTFSSDGPVWIANSGLSSLASIARGRTAVAGPNTEIHFFPAGNNIRCLVGQDATFEVLGGATAYVERMGWSNKTGMSMVSSNANSKLVFDIYSASEFWASKQTFATYDGGTMTCTSTTAMGDKSPTVIADGAGSVTDLSKVSVLTGAMTLRSTNGGTIKIGGIRNQKTAGSIACTGASAIEVTDVLDFPLNSQSINPTLTLAGADPKITIAKASTFGRYTNANYLKMNLTPELSWNNGVRIEGKATDGTNGKMTFYTGIKYDVDVTAFTNYYGKWQMTLAKVGKTMSFTAPPEGWISASGEGAPNCSVAVAKSDNTVVVTVTAKNAASGAVAAVNSGDAATVFYETLEAAVAAAPDGATVFLIGDVVVNGKLEAKDKSITISALEPVTLSVLGKLGEGITIDEANVTLVEKSGIILFVK